MFSAAEVEQFHRDGYVIVRGLASAASCAAMLNVARDQLAAMREPLEYEADVGYPGAPSSKEELGGRTVRRLLQAYARHPSFAAWATSPAVIDRLHQLIGPRIVLPQAHHNCVMTKRPRFSSETAWHQDIRYWAYDRPELVNVWLALGEERPDNGCLMLLPGTHRMRFARTQLDAALFLRTDLPESQALIARRVYAELAPGDVLFFHALTFHAAGRNTSDDTKFSLVFTYRPADNHPLPGTRSAQTPEVALPG